MGMQALGKVIYMVSSKDSDKGPWGGITRVMYGLRF